MYKNPVFRNGEENEKVIRYPHADPDHHQKLTTSRGSPLVPSLVDVRFRVRQLSCSQNDRHMRDVPPNLHVVGGCNKYIMKYRK